MRATWVFGLLIITSLSIPTTALGAETLKEVISEGKVSGAVRSYYNFRDFDTKPDTSAFALGGHLHAETAPLYGATVGGTFYMSDDVGTRDEDPARRNTNLPDDAYVFGEAYFQYRGFDTVFGIGRQKIDTPLANPSDAFMIPITFETISLSNTSIKNLTVSAYYLDRIKNRPSDEFVNVGRFTTDRLGMAKSSNRGTGIMGAVYSAKSMKLQGWGYFFPDLFHVAYLQADYSFPQVWGVTPDLAAQYIYEGNSGDDFLGDVDVNGFGVKISGKRGPFGLLFAYNHVVSEGGAFRNGAVLAPFSFATGPLFTNSMVETLENSDAGDAFRVALDYKFWDPFTARVSFVAYERDIAPDTTETDIDLTYDALKGFLEGLSFRIRLGIIESGTASADLVELRPQLQYVF
ncbi:MAG: OprD family porin [Pseudomonadota bacterium]|nr:OprD family porin [Pseudomonadota bacterium]